ncbi:hypothetical protein [Devosia sp. LjRoot3]|uniref:hypothetical protein n=1 Tax=Devosia sp. LjRoot3 TaxID=3342319 RepID=UPI003ED04632
MCNRATPFDHDRFPDKVEYFFNSTRFQCSFGVGEDCLAAALKNVLDWTACEYLRATRLSLSGGSDAGQTYWLELSYPYRDTPGPHYSSVLAILNSPNNVAIDTSGKWFRMLARLESDDPEPMVRTLGTQSLWHSAV